MTRAGLLEITTKAGMSFRISDIRICLCRPITKTTGWEEPPFAKSNRERSRRAEFEKQTRRYPPYKQSRNVL
jgi:hypothetical protein